MQTITFTCETITPLVMNGAEDNHPELRPASIKGVLRFWWRALHGHLSLKELKEKEGIIFGNTERRSRLLIRIIETLTENDYCQPKVELLPHKDKSNQRSPVNAFSENKAFKIRFDFDKNIITEQELKNLFILTCTLGGFGKRSRRGFGSISIKNEKMPTTLKEIYDLLPPQYFEPFTIGDTLIESDFRRTNRNEEYPYIQSIEIGQVPNIEIKKAIITASHEVKDDEYKRAEDIAIRRNDYRDFFNKKTQQKESKPDILKHSNFEKALGDGSNRFASPIYVSTIGQNIIMTTLNSVPPTKGRYDEVACEKLQEKFKTKLR